MKLKMYFVMLAMGLFSFAMQSCSDDDDNALPVNQAVEEAFVAQFGNVQHSWTKSASGKNVAKFTNKENVATEAWFDDKGDWQMTETDIQFDKLPKAVKTAFNDLMATKYAGWTKDDVDMLQRKDMATVYVVEIEKGNEEFDLYFDENGNLLKEVADKEDDSEDYLPTALPASVVSFLEKEFTGYAVVDAELDKKDNLFEVDILLGQEKLEVSFAPDTYAWVSTSKDVLFASLPGAVKTAAEEALKGFPAGAELDDDAEFVQTPNGDYYEIEVEIEGQPSKYIYLNVDGTPRA